MSPCQMIVCVLTYLLNNQCQNVLFYILLYFYIQNVSESILVIAASRTSRRDNLDF